MSMSESIRKYAAKQPNAKASAIAKALGIKSSYVSTVLWNLKKQKEKEAPIAEDTVTNTGDKFMEAMVFAAGAGRRVHPVTGKSLMQGADPLPITMHDPVNHPAHYTVGGIETIDFIEAKKLGYNLGNVVKYLTRADHKGNKLEDLRKAQWYLTREINSLK